MQHRNWQCPKCDNAVFETREMRAEGGALSAIFDMSTNKFSVVTCTRCQYSELYRVRSSRIESVLDLFAT